MPSVGRVEVLTREITISLHRAIDTTTKVVEELRSKGAGQDDLKTAFDRVDALRHLLTELGSTSTVDGITYHPRTLIRWFEILETILTPGDPRLRVKVVSIHIL
jgi:hypothetical protein